MEITLFWLLVTYLAIQSSLVSAQESCEQVHNFNLTGTVSIPYPQLPGANNPSGNYTLTEYVYFSDDPASPSIPSNQTITAVNSSGGPVFYDTFPYQGCAIFLSNLQHTSSNNGYINDGSENSCSSALSSGCMKELVDYVNDTAKQMSQSNATGQDACGNFNLLYICQPAEFNSVSSMDLFHPHPNVSAGADFEEKGCQTDSDDTIFQLLGSIWRGYAFDENLSTITNIVTPVIITAWNNATSEQDEWADTRMFCMSPDMYAPGSKNGAVSWYTGSGVTRILAVASASVGLIMLI